MTSMTLPHTATATTSSALTPSSPGLSRLLRSIRRRNADPAPRTVPPSASTRPEDGHLPAPTARGCLRLTLHDGVSRLYLLDAHDFAATTSPDVAYDARVHAAYLLALQGHRPEWLAHHLDLPPSATDSIAEHAERSGPDGPGTMPPRS